VVAAACILPKDLSLPGIDDSKKLTEKQRAEFYELLISQTCYGIGIVDVATIDEINILQATFLAMIQAVQALSQKADYILVDGPYTPKFGTPSLGIIDGDALCQSIMAASILAKHTRDQLMIAHHEKWPQYGFLSNKGYGTRKHLEALQLHGPCELHRRSFAPVREAMMGKQVTDVGSNDANESNKPQLQGLSF
jgi:ribonuclease HII